MVMHPGYPRGPRLPIVPPFSTVDDGFSARPPIDNEIPDSANVQSNPGPGANVPNSVENQRESRQAQLNLGKF